MQHMNLNPSSLQNQQGVGLIETMISLFTLAVGLLGVMAMQTLSVQSTQRAEYVSYASLLGSQMVQMIGAYDAFDDKASTAYIDLESNNSIKDVASCAEGCSRDEQLVRDINDWSNQIISLLPSGIGTVTYDNAREMFTVLIMWDSNRTGVNGRNCSGDPEVDLACYRLQVQI